MCLAIFILISLLRTAADSFCRMSPWEPRWKPEAGCCSLLQPRSARLGAGRAATRRTRLYVAWRGPSWEQVHCRPQHRREERKNTPHRHLTIQVHPSTHTHGPHAHRLLHRRAWNSSSFVVTVKCSTCISIALPGSWLGRCTWFSWRLWFVGLTTLLCSELIIDIILLSVAMATSWEAFNFPSSIIIIYEAICCGKWIQAHLHDW